MIVTKDLLQKARYEIKFNAPSSQYERIKQWIFLHQANMYKPHQSNIINNIYFDNLNLDSFYENISGCSLRTKMRLRWYGDTLNPKTTRLETKIKKNNLGWKTVEEVKFEKNLSKLNYPKIIEIINSQVSNVTKLRLNSVNVPILINKYNRDYFISNDQKIRITIDTNIKFYDQRHHKKINLKFNEVPIECLITEFKMNASDVKLGEKIISSIGLSRTKSSKYVIGVQNILGI